MNGFHEWHGIDLKGGGPHIIRNNLWYSERKPKFVRYMEPSQPEITVDAFGAQIESETELGVDPMFTDAAAGDFTLKDNSPAKGTGDNGVDRGAYAVYPKTDVGYNENLGLLEDVNISFSELNSSAKPGETISIELTLNKRAKKTMTFEVVPVAGDAQIDKDFTFLDSQTVTFKAGESKKTIRIKIPEGYDLDQLLALRIQPTGDTRLEAVGPRNLHLLKIIRVSTRVLTINNVGDSMGHSIVEYHEPGEKITVDAKTRDGYTFDSWETGYHDVKLDSYEVDGTRITFEMPDRDITLRADWIPSGTIVNVTGISFDSNSLSLKVGDKSTIEATISPSNATDKIILWTSSNPLVASVDANGVVTALSEGTADIMARTLEDSDKQYTSKCKVTVAK